MFDNSVVQLQVFLRAKESGQNKTEEALVKVVIRGINDRTVSSKTVVCFCLPRDISLTSILYYRYRAYTRVMGPPIVMCGPRISYMEYEDSSSRCMNRIDEYE
jgi:hypothetical protein